MEKKNNLVELPLESIVPDPDQPRKDFNEESLKELAESIRQHGILQPITVKPIEGGKYQIITGERRWRACIKARLPTIKAIIFEKEISEAEKHELQLVENLHRDDLDSIEEAETYKRLIQEFGYTHEELAKRIGKSREYITNKLRLLKLPDNVKKALQEGKITEGHARALISLSNDKQEEILGRVLSEGLSVRQTEKLIKHDIVSRETPTSDIPEDGLIIGVWISKETYNRLIRVANSQKVTMEKLCSKILEREASKSE